MPSHSMSGLGILSRFQPLRDVSDPCSASISPRVVMPRASRSHRKRFNTCQVMVASARARCSPAVCIPSDCATFPRLFDVKV